MLFVLALTKLDSKGFFKEVSVKRDYSLVVALTSLSPEHNCIACKQFMPELGLLKSDHVQFAYVDYKDGEDVFRKFQVRYIPQVYIYPPDTADPISYSVNDNGVTAEDLALFLKQKLDVKVEVHRPVDYTRWAIVAASILAGLLLLKIFSSALFLVFQNKQMWLTGSMVLFFDIGIDRVFHWRSHVESDSSSSAIGKNPLCTRIQQSVRLGNPDYRRHM
jgi:hypothetical protein